MLKSLDKKLWTLLCQDLWQCFGLVLGFFLVLNILKKTKKTHTAVSSVLQTELQNPVLQCTNGFLGWGM